MKTKESEIKATADRMANGWAAVLEFPNGGRQRFTSRHGTMDGAILEARHGLKCRTLYPNACVPDPAPNCLQELSNLR